MMINDQRPWAWSKMVNPPLSKTSFRKSMCFSGRNFGRQNFFSKIGASNLPKKETVDIKNRHIWISKIWLFFHCVVRFQKFQWRLSLLLPSDFRNVCQGQAFLNGPVENIQHLVVLADTSWSNAKIWLTVGLRPFCHANTHVDEDVSHFFSMGGNKTPTQIKFFFKKKHSSFGVV